MAVSDKKATTDNKQKALDTAIAQIERQFGKGAVMRLGQDSGMNVEAISTGSLSLDAATGIGGLPRGRIVEIYGPESSGKTTLALHSIAETQKIGGEAAFIDAEHALDPVYAANLGVNVDELLVSQPDNGEQALEIAEQLVRSGAIDILVVDSVAALVPRAEIEGEMGDSHVGLHARLMSQALRKLAGAVSKSNCLIIEKGGIEKGDLALIIADTNNKHVLSILGALRQSMAKKLDIIPEGVYNLLWIVEMPFFEYDEESGEWLAMHHPFTAPMDECLDYLETDKGNVRALCYDMVLNGIELSSGSIRITDPELQSRIFDLLGLSHEEAMQKFGYLIDAFKYGAPPHGGFGLGLDRLCMQLIGADTLRDVLAFPKIKDASEPMTECPSSVDDLQLDEHGIKLAAPAEEENAE